MTPTMAEREAELAALQAAFDEYIASSRELEEELDAELAKMRKFLLGRVSRFPGVIFVVCSLSTGFSLFLHSHLTKLHKNYCILHRNFILYQ